MIWSAQVAKKKFHCAQKEHQIFFMHYYGGCKPYVSEEFQNLFHGSSSSSSFSYFAISLRLNPYETNADVWRTCVEAMPGRRRRPCLFTWRSGKDTGLNGHPKFLSAVHAIVGKTAASQECCWKKWRSPKRPRKVSGRTLNKVFEYSGFGQLAVWPKIATWRSCFKRDKDLHSIWGDLPLI